MSKKTKKTNDVSFLDDPVRLQKFVINAIWCAAGISIFMVVAFIFIRSDNPLGVFMLVGIMTIFGVIGYFWRKFKSSLRSDDTINDTTMDDDDMED